MSDDDDHTDHVHHSGFDPWNPIVGWRPIVIRKVHRRVCPPRWEVTVYGVVRDIYVTGADAINAVHRDLVAAERGVGE